MNDDDDMNDDEPASNDSLDHSLIPKCFGLATRYHQIRVSEKRMLASAAIGMSSNHCELLAQAVPARPDRDHFRVTSCVELSQPGLFRDSNMKCFRSVTQLDMW